LGAYLHTVRTTFSADYSGKAYLIFAKVGSGDLTVTIFAFGTTLVEQRSVQIYLRVDWIHGLFADFAFLHHVSISILLSYLISNTSAVQNKEVLAVQRR
jgi:hypothetical protein